MATGPCWKSVLGSSWLVGFLDENGEMSGPDIAFLYPDLHTALVGKFKEGKLVSAFHHRVIGNALIEGVMMPKFEKVKNSEYR